MKASIKKQLNQLLTLVRSVGVKVEWKQLSKNILGQYDLTNKTITLRKGCCYKTFIHECIHALQHYVEENLGIELNIGGKITKHIKKNYNKSEWLCESQAYSNEGKLEYIIALFKLFLGEELTVKEKAILISNLSISLSALIERFQSVLDSQTNKIIKFAQNAFRSFGAKVFIT